MAHPRCVGCGEIGLDYHYNNSPRNVQQRVFARQLRAAVSLGKPLTIHTREADEDTADIETGGAGRSQGTPPSLPIAHVLARRRLLTSPLRPASP